MHRSVDRRRFLASAVLTAGVAGLRPHLGAGRSRAARQGAAELSALWVAFDPLVNATTPLFDQFGEEHNVTITVNTVPFSDWDRTIRSTPQQPDAPDLMIVDGPNVLSYAVNGLLRPLDDVFTDEDLEDFLPGTTKAAFFRDEFYGPATNESSQALFYNKRLTDKHGITPPSTLAEAWTWVEAREIFKQIQEAERAERGDDQFWALFIGQGGRLGGGTYTGGMLIRSNGAPGSPTFMAVSEDGLTTDGYINTPEAIAALQFLQDLYVADELVPSSETPDFFYNEQVAFWLSTPVFVNVITEQNPELTFSVTPCPYHQTPIVHTDSFHIGVSAYSDQGDLAAALVAFLTSPNGSLAMSQAQGTIPQRRSVLTEFPEFREEPMKVFIDTVEQWAQPRPITPGFSEYDSVYETMLADIATGAPVADTADAAARRIDAQLARYASLID